MKAVYLYPNTTFATEFRSDTLYGLLLVAIKNVYGEELLLDMLEQFDSGKPPFVLSSAFPFVASNTGEIVHYLPKPLNTNFNTGNLAKEDVDKLKKFKKVDLISKDIFEKIINGELSEKEYFNNGNWDKISKPLKTVNVLKTSIDRLTGSTLELEGRGQLHYSEEYYIESDTKFEVIGSESRNGLYFIVQSNDEVFQYIEGGLRFLQHFGLGGDNSSGKGYFSVEISSFDIRHPDSSDAKTILSLLSPNANELDMIENHKDLCAYKYEVRRGHIGKHFVNSTQYKKEGVTVFTEGSILPLPDKNAPGSTRIVANVEDISIRYIGYALCFPVNFKGE